jgi:hypothetical protein
VLSSREHKTPFPSECVSFRHHDPHLTLEHFRPGAAHFGTLFLSQTDCLCTDEHEGSNNKRVSLRHHDPHLALEHFRLGATHFETSIDKRTGPNELIYRILEVETQFIMISTYMHIVFSGCITRLNFLTDLE